MLIDIFLFFLPFFSFFLLWFYSKKPTNNKIWKEDQEISPIISINNEFIHIENIRDFRYESETKYQKKYISQKFRINDLEGLDYCVEPFTNILGIAHTLFSFKLKNGQHIVISIEVRKIKNQKFNLFKTFFREYELMYVISTEEDAIKLRTNVRGDKLYLFPINGEKEFISKLFIDILKRAQEVQKNPEFYHPWFNSCTSNLFDHVNNMLPKKKRVRKGIQSILPGFTKELIFDMHYVLNQEYHNKDFKYYQINEKAIQCKKNFSKCIRKHKFKEN